MPRGCAAEIKPIEPVWVMPAKGAKVTEPAQQLIRVNGDMEPLTCATLTALLDAKEIGANARGVAVAINGAVVPRAQWPQQRLAAGDQIEIVRARQGG